MNYLFVVKTANRKTGPIPVTYSPRQSCPTSCSFMDNGCYADAHPTRFHWDNISEGRTGIHWRDMIDEIAALPEGTLWRHNVAGDLINYKGMISTYQIDNLIMANAGKRGFTYTHHKLTMHNRRLIRKANLNGFTINISADSLQAADEAFDMAIGPVVTVLPASHTTNTKTPKGRTVVICPATQRDDVTCASCKLCAVPSRETIVGFPAHGPRQRLVSKIVFHKNGV